MGKNGSSKWGLATIVGDLFSPILAGMVVPSDYRRTRMAMKRLGLALYAGVMVFALAACAVPEKMS